jgi:hypothetical protein
MVALRSGFSILLAIHHLALEEEVSLRQELPQYSGNHPRCLPRKKFPPYDLIKYQKQKGVFPLYRLLHTGTIKVILTSTIINYFIIY